VGKRGVAASRGCFVEERVEPGKPSCVGSTAVNDGGGRGLDPLLVLVCVGGLPLAQPERFSYALTVDAPVTHTAKNGKAQVSTTTCVLRRTWSWAKQ